MSCTTKCGCKESYSFLLVKGPVFFVWNAEAPSRNES